MCLCVYIYIISYLFKNLVLFFNKQKQSNNNKKTFVWRFCWFPEIYSLSEESEAHSTVSIYFP